MKKKVKKIIDWLLGGDGALDRLAETISRG